MDQMEVFWRQPVAQPYSLTAFITAEGFMQFSLLRLSEDNETCQNKSEPPSIRARTERLCLHHILRAQYRSPFHSIRPRPLRSRGVGLLPLYGYIPDHQSTLSRKTMVHRCPLVSVNDPGGDVLWAPSHILFVLTIPHFTYLFLDYSLLDRRSNLSQPVIPAS